MNSFPSLKFFALILSAAFLVACATPSQLYWDHKVKELCEKDGGVTVYEKVELTKEELKTMRNSSGKISVPFEWENKNSPYYISSKSELIINETPKVWRSELLLIRRMDGKVLAASVYYARRGGDIPDGISEPSHYGCSKVTGINFDLIKSVFN